MCTFYFGVEKIMKNEFFDLAFAEAEKAFNINEVPIGAVIVKDGKIIAKGHNIKENQRNVICHAEMLAINEASKVLNNWRLSDCDIYVTLDPCPMCASAIKQARIKNVYSALENLDKSNSEIVNRIFENSDINSATNFITNLSVEKAKNLMQSFFKNRR